MRIDPKSAKILSVIQHQASEPIASIAKQSKLPSHVVQYQLKKLLDDGIIRRGVIINHARIGLQLYQAYLKANPGLYLNSKKLFQFFRQSSYVNWCAQLGGEYQIGLSLAVNKVSELSDYFDAITKKFSDPISQKTLSQIISYYVYPKRYFEYNKYALSKAPIEVSSEAEASEPDKLDMQIIGTLANHSLGSNSEMAKNLGIARTTFEYRLKKLVDSKVIASFVYYINSRKLGYSTFRILVAVKGPRNTALEKIKLFAKDELSVTFLLHSLGPWDFELVVELIEASDMLEVVSRLQAKVPDIIVRMQTVPVLEQSTSSAFLKPII